MCSIQVCLGCVLIALYWQIQHIQTLVFNTCLDNCYTCKVFKPKNLILHGNQARFMQLESVGFKYYMPSKAVGGLLDACPDLAFVKS